MKKTLLGLMVLLTLTPVMACAMSYCPMQESSSAEMPCHKSERSESTDVPMLALDCMGIDLFQQVLTDNVPQPENPLLDYIAFSWVDVTKVQRTQDIDINGIRAPPEYFSNNKTDVSLILTTQRFRI